MSERPNSTGMRVIANRIPALLAGLALAAPVWGDAIRFPEVPSISPDGSMIVFSWAEDLWAVGRNGGAATRLTSNQGDESQSAFNATGDMLAFESTRDGSRDLYVMDVSVERGMLIGGDARRITVIPGSAYLGGFSADGEALLFSSTFEPSMYRHARMYRAPLDGGPVTRLTDAYGAEVSQNLTGTGTIFHRGSGASNNRPAYQGSGAHEIWRMNQNGSFTQVTRFEGNDHEGHELPDGSIVFISSRDGQNNLWMLAPNARDNGTTNSPGLRQLTSFRPTGEQLTLGHGVRDLEVSADGKTAVFCVWDTLYTLDLTARGATPNAVPLRTAADDDLLPYQRVNVSSQVSDQALSPDGKTMAVIARGEVFIRSTDDPGYTRRVTNTVGREDGLAWSPDGRYLYFTSDESGMEGIYRASVTLTRSDVYPDEEEATSSAAAPAGGGGAASGEASGGDTPRRGPGGPGGGRRGPRPDDSIQHTATVINAMLGLSDDAFATQVTDLQPAADPVSGTWSGTVTGPEPLPPDGLPLSMTIRLSGTTVSGSMQAGAMPMVEFSGGTWTASARTLTWSMTVQEASAAVEARLDDAGAMSGTVSVDDAVFRFNATRTAAAEPAAGDEPEGEATEAETAAPKTDHGARWADALRFSVEPFLVEADAPHTRTNISPDGRSMLVVRGNGDLIHINLADNSRRVLFEGWNAPDVEWAWDSRHIVFERSDLWFNSDIWIMDTAANDDGSSREPVNITRHPDIDTNPRLSHDGRVLTFQSDRAGENFNFDIYCVYLDRDLEVMEGFEYDEHFKEVRDALNKRKIPEEIDFAADYTPPTPFEFDLDDAYLRVRRLTSFPGSESVVAISPAGDRILFNGNIDGTYALYSVDHRGSDRKTVLSGGASGRANYLGDKIVYRRGSASTVSINGGSASSYGISATIDVVIADAQRQKALELGRTFGATFYHPTMKDLDWAGLTARYAELASYTRTTSSYNRVMNMLLGEVNGSHIGVSGGGLDGYSSPNAASHGAIGADLTPVAGGYRVDSVLPGSPADARRSRLNVGDILVAVEDTVLAPSPDAMPSIDFNAVMLGRNNTETLMEVRRSTDGVLADDTAMILIVPTSTGAISNMAYEQGVLDRRAEVDRLSNGRLGYLHIRGMSEAYVRDFERDLYAAAHGRDGLIIDVRDNGGGSTADYLLSSLTQPQHSFTVPRGADINTTPRDAYPRDRRYIYSYPHPINVLINQNSFSNAEIFAHAIKHIGRGSLIGTETFGGVISTGAFRLVDGTNVRQPFRGWYLPKPDGPMDLENNGAEPDVDVPQTPMDEAAGRDRQLEAAVRELLDRIGRERR